MTLKERIWGAILGRKIDRVPFTTYPGLFPEREPLVKAGLIGTMNRCSVYRESSSGKIEVKKEEYKGGNENRVRYTYKTPVGEVWETLRTGGGYGTNLRGEFLIKRPEDYKVIEFMMRDAVYTPNYDGFRAAEESLSLIHI